MDTNLIFAYIFGGILVVVGLVILARPLKFVIKIAMNSTLGAIALIIFNLIGSFFNMCIGINITTALTVGILGIPGLILLMIMQIIFKS